MSPDVKFKRNVALGCFALFLANIVLAFLLIRNPTMAKNSFFLSRYKLYFLSGPFFKEENIRSVNIFQVQFKEADTAWGEWIFPDRGNFHEYQRNLARYDKLKRSDFERNLGRALVARLAKDTLKRYSDVPEFKEMDHYLHDQYAPINTDSVHLLYTVKWVKLTGRQTHIDTLFNITYKPL